MMLPKNRQTRKSKFNGKKGVLPPFRCEKCDIYYGSLRGLLYKHSAANCKPQEFQVRDYVDIELPEDRRLVSVALARGAEEDFSMYPE